MADSSVTPGSQTTEFWLTKVAAILGGVVTVLGIVLSALGPLFDSLHAQFPNAGWITTVAGLIAAILPVIAYISGRSSIKTAAIQSSTAQALIASKTATPNP